MKSHKGFNVLELLIVIIIMGIGATLALTNWGPFKEGTISKEAVDGLKRIKDAEKFYRMQFGTFYPCCGISSAGCPSCPVVLTNSDPNVVRDTINANLKISLPQSSYWEYKIYRPSEGVFTAKARRTADHNIVLCLTEDAYGVHQDEPSASGCNWD